MRTFTPWTQMPGDRTTRRGFVSRTSTVVSRAAGRVRVARRSTATAWFRRTPMDPTPAPHNMELSQRDSIMIGQLVRDRAGQEYGRS